MTTSQFRLTLGMPLSRARRAFTLIEIVLTMSIVTLVVLPILGLVALGLDSAGDARKTSTSSLVANHLIGRVQQADTAQLQAWEGGTNSLEFFYDLDGQYLGTSGSDQSDSRYTAKLSFPSDLGGSQNLGLGLSASANPHLLPFVVLISDKPGALGSAAILNQDSEVRRYPALAIDLEKSP